MRSLILCRSNRKCVVENLLFCSYLGRLVTQAFEKVDLIRLSCINLFFAVSIGTSVASKKIGLLVISELNMPTNFSRCSVPECTSKQILFGLSMKNCRRHTSKVKQQAFIRTASPI